MWRHPSTVRVVLVDWVSALRAARPHHQTVIPSTIALASPIEQPVTSR
jgi:hypothetical protein